MAKKSKSRRASGTGALFFSAARGVWVGRVVVGRRPDGTPHVVERSHAEQAEVVRRLKEAAPPGPEVTVAEYAQRWQKEMKVRGRTTDSRANSLKNHIVPVLGGVRVCDLTPGQIERAARTWGESVGSPNTVRLMLDHLSAMMGEAVREGVRADNPVKLVRRPKAVKKKIDPFTVAELAAIVAGGAELPRGRVASLLAATGLRVGEALALDVTDYDPATRLLSVTKTTNLKRQTGPTKSAGGVRTITVPSACAPALLAAVGTRTSGPLFASRSGGRVGHDGVSRAFAAVLERLGLRRRNPHQLRHSCATHLIAAGVPLGDVARWIGDTVQTLVKTYLHPTGYDVGAAVESLFSGAKVGAGAGDVPK